MPEPPRPWYVTLFERDWYDLLAPGGARSPVDPEQYAAQTDREAAFVAAILDLPHGARVLDLCCGWGRHTLRLARRGYRMTGLDLSPYHIELAAAAARDSGVEVEWLEADMRDIPAVDASFDGVINLFTAFGYFADDENQRVLEEVARVLKPGGRFLVDLINRDWLMHAFRDAEWREEADGRLILERRRWAAQTGRVHAEWIVIDREGGRRAHAHDTRVYSLQELELRLSLAGLRVRRSFGHLDDESFSRHARRLVVLAEKSQGTGSSSR